MQPNGGAGRGSAGFAISEREAEAETQMRARRIERLALLALAVIAGACSLAFSSTSLDRSLWVDEAWVANSAAAPTLQGVFHYDSWLQTSPPLFLLLVRFAIQCFGLANVSLRTVPWLMSILAAICIALLARSILSRRFAVLAWVLVILSPTVIVFSCTLKQYSSEIAATGMILLAAVYYLRTPDSRRFGLLTGTAVIALLAAYSTAFLIPGVVAAVALSSRRRALLLALATGITGLIEFFLLIVPNNSPSLWDYWSGGLEARLHTHPVIASAVVWFRQLPIPEQALERTNIAGWAALGVLVGPAVIAGLAVSIQRLRRRRPELFVRQLILAAPCLLFVAANGLAGYPLTFRTSLFALPCVVLLIALSWQVSAGLAIVKLRRPWLRRTVSSSVIWAVILAIAAGIGRSSLRIEPEEDAAAAVDYVRQNSDPADLIWVHASCSETFKLYARMQGWQNPPVRHGMTGWACCPRGLPPSRGASTEAAVRADMANGPRLPSGVWLMYTNRSAHWDFAGLDEPRVMKQVLREQGCVEIPVQGFLNVGVSRFRCPGTAK